MIVIEPEDILAAREGDRSALARLVEEIHRPLYNLSIRMLGQVADAEDAAQEIVIQVITHLGSLQNPQAAGAWVYRIAMRHLVKHRKRSRVEAMRLDLRAFSADLEDGLEQIPDPVAADPYREILALEVKVGCTLALLTCLSRPLRATYVLADIYQFSDTEGANILDIEPATYRQRLRRARALVDGFTRRHCGLVEDKASCRCAGRVTQAVRLGRVDPASAHRRGPGLIQIRDEVRRLEGARAAAALMRSNPEFEPSPQLAASLLGLAP